MCVQSPVVQHTNEGSFLELYAKPIRRKESDQRIVVLDIETTGLHPQRGQRINEIGAVALQECQIVAEFHSLIRLQRHIPRISEIDLQMQKME